MEGGGGWGWEQTETPARAEGLQRGGQERLLAAREWKKEEGMRGGFLGKVAFQLGLQEENVNKTKQPNK